MKKGNFFQRLLLKRELKEELKKAEEEFNREWNWVHISQRKDLSALSGSHQWLKEMFIPATERKNYISESKLYRERARAQINQKTKDNEQALSIYFLSREARIYDNFAKVTGDPIYFAKAVEGFEEVIQRESIHPCPRISIYAGNSEKFMGNMHKYARAARAHYKEITGKELPHHHPISKGKDLEGTIAVLGIIGGILLLPTSITGNAIADLTPQGNSFLGIGLIVAGLIAAFFWFKGRQQ